MIREYETLFILFYEYPVGGYMESLKSRETDEEVENTGNTLFPSPGQQCRVHQP